jgi:protein-disulfide isomerase
LEIAPSDAKVRAMVLWRVLGNAFALCVVNLNVATCRSTSGEEGPEPETKAAPEVELAGVDTGKLTAREKREWSTYVSEQLAPCSDQPVSVAQCIKESRPCATCLPAARFLVTQVTRGRTRTQVETAYRVRFAEDEQKTVSPEDSPSKGSADAPVTIVEWADFECPFCAAAAPVLEKAIERYPGYVRLVFKNYPLASHEHAEEAARASVAASKQGKFWEMHHALFENQNQGLDREAIESLAVKIGLDRKQFIADLESEAVADAVMKDRKQAEKLGLRGTPMIYINGRQFELELFSLVEDLDDWLELEIEQRTGKSVKPKDLPESGPQAPSSVAPSARAPSISALPAEAPHGRKTP